MSTPISHRPEEQLTKFFSMLRRALVYTLAVALPLALIVAYHY